MQAHFIAGDRPEPLFPCAELVYTVSSWTSCLRYLWYKDPITYPCQVHPTKMGTHGCRSLFYFKLLVERQGGSYKPVLMDLFCHFFLVFLFLFLPKTIQRHEYYVMDCEGLERESCKMHISHSINVRDAVQKHGYSSLASSVSQVIPADLLDVSK